MSKLHYQIQQILVSGESPVDLSEGIFVNLQHNLFYDLENELLSELAKLGLHPIPYKYNKTAHCISFWIKVDNRSMLIQCQYESIVLH